MSDEIICYFIQHEDTGVATFIDQFQYDNGFLKNNPRWQLIRAIYNQDKLEEENKALRELVLVTLQEAKALGLSSNKIDLFEDKLKKIGGE